MQDTATKSESVVNQLKDKKLFREACYVDGAWIRAKSGGAVQVDNPATGEIIGSVPKLGAAETRGAIEAADRAFSSWSKKTGKERAVVLRRWFDLMMQNQEDLARLMTLEQGKPLTETRGEVEKSGLNDRLDLARRVGFPARIARHNREQIEFHLRPVGGVT